MDLFRSLYFLSLVLFVRLVSLNLPEQLLIFFLGVRKFFFLFDNDCRGLSIVWYNVLTLVL